MNETPLNRNAVRQAAAHAARLAGTGQLAGAIAHSHTELRLFLKATPCPLCGNGPLENVDRKGNGGPCCTTPAKAGGKQDTPQVVSVRARCGACREFSDYKFRVSVVPTVIPHQDTEIVNLTDEPSHIIDISQWVTLYFVFHDEAARESEKTHRRRLELQAVQCLNEALKFYGDEDNDLPPPSAFFHESSRRRLKDHPQEFSRQRLINFRASLPKPLGVRKSKPD